MMSQIDVGSSIDKEVRDIKKRIGLSCVKAVCSKLTLFRVFTKVSHYNPITVCLACAAFGVASMI